VEPQLSIVVFVGPSIARGEVTKLLPRSRILPPAAQGDVYRAAQKRPVAIAIIDGYFQRVPAVWHKEILWALTEGIPVFGASSMGALRAAELAPFGMVGMGQVFEAYLNGILEDDDEVAIIHGPAELGYLPLSEAMVDIRATLAAAQAADVASGSLARLTADYAKALHYPYRSISAALDQLSDTRSLTEEIARLRAWIADNFVSVKHDDAVALLTYLAAQQDRGFIAPEVSYRVEQTEVWYRAMHAIRYDSEPRATAEPSAEAVLEELRLQPAALTEVRQRALHRMLASDYAGRQNWRATPADLSSHAASFRKARGLEDAQDLQRWLDRHHLDEQGFLRLLTQEIWLARTETALELGLDPFLLAHLQASGFYEELSSRARDKAATLGATGNLTAEALDLDTSGLMAWFVLEVFGKPLNITAQEYAAETGFVVPEALLRALTREYQYRMKRPRDA
jgi:hypothetical protein